MNRQETLELIAYDEWANDRILGALRSLPVPELSRNLGSSFPTLRGTFAHLVAGEWLWLERWCGRSPGAAPPWLAGGPFDELVGVLRDVEKKRRERLETATDGELADRVTFTYLDGRPGGFRLGDLVLHVVNHSSYHRGQIVTMIRQVGGEVKATDLVAWLERRPG